MSPPETLASNGNVEHQSLQEQLVGRAAEELDPPVAEELDLPVAEELDPSVAEAGPLTISKSEAPETLLFNGGPEPSPPKDSNEDSDDASDHNPAGSAGGVRSCFRG